MSQKSIGQVKNILDNAAEEGVISQKSLQIIDINEVVLAGIQGTDIDDILATDVTLVTVIIDETGSISGGGLAKAVIEGQNLMIEALLNSKQKDNILIAQWKLKDKSVLIHSYVGLDLALKLNKANYNPDGETALYDVWVEVLASNVAYAQQLKAAGTPVKNIVVVITDGQDTCSHRYRFGDCKKINKDLLASEQFILAFVGMAATVQDETYFRLIAEDMGFPDGAILTAQATSSEIRKIFNLVSQSAIRASQKAVTPAAQNSFFNP